MAADAGAGLVAPHLLAGLGVETEEVAAGVARDDQAAGGAEHTGEHRHRIPVRPLRLAGAHVDGRQVAVGLAFRGIGRDRLAAEEGNPLDEDDDALAEHHAALDRRHVGETGFRAVGAGVGGVVAAGEAGADALSRLLGRFHRGVDDRAAVLVQRRPVQLVDVLAGMQEAAVAAVEHVEVAVAIRLNEGGNGLFVDLDVDQPDLGVAVVVPNVVGRELEVPLALPGLDVDRQHAVAVEVVAGPCVAAPVGRRVAGGPEQGLRRRVVAAGRPGGGAARLVRFAGPGLDSGLARVRHRVVAPEELAGLQVVAVEEAPDSVLAAADADDHHALRDERGRRDGEALGVGNDLNIPGEFACLAVEGQQTGVQGAHHDEIAGDADAAVHRPAADPQVGGVLVVVAPEQAPVSRVVGEQAVHRRGQVEDPVVDYGGGFELAGDAGLGDPGETEVGDALRRQLGDRRVAPACVVAAVVEPGLPRRGRFEQRLLDGSRAVAHLGRRRPVVLGWRGHAFLLGSERDRHGGEDGHRAGRGAPSPGSCPNLRGPGMCCSLKRRGSHRQTPS